LSLLHLTTGPCHHQAPNFFDHKSILDLGSGTGVLGIWLFAWLCRFRPHCGARIVVTGAPPPPIPRVDILAAGIIRAREILPLASFIFFPIRLCLIFIPLALSRAVLLLDPCLRFALLLFLL
jgi:hypothetical protein